MQREIFYIHSHTELFLLPFQKTVCQPLAHRFVVQFQTSISKDNSSHESKYHIRDTFCHCSVIVAYPSCISVYQRIMGDINRIGNISQELAYGSRALTGHLAAGSHRNNDREDADNTESLVKPVHPVTILTSDTGNGKNHHNQQAAPPESTLFKPYQPAEA